MHATFSHDKSIQKVVSKKIRIRQSYSPILTVAFSWITVYISEMCK